MPVGQAILVSQDFRLGGRIPKAILPKPAASDKVADEVIQCTLQNARKVNDLQVRTAQTPISLFEIWQTQGYNTKVWVKLCVYTQTNRYTRESQVGHTSKRLLV